ncbi:hypothetical protein [Weissella paramesenteroides]|uniref:hypothetical protein n=1 Tax=Weissella paramesenteroides TaxID=1249 RepID=UPI00223B7020|nr:hypothetical protein [Weissella paramesenteroides]MCT0484877.1 hypothetical protein [Weissella paramesenteroides]
MLKGIQAGYIDERERLAVLANSIAYFSNAKKPKSKKVFDRAKEERLLEEAYADGNAQNKPLMRSVLNYMASSLLHSEKGVKYGI